MILPRLQNTAPIALDLGATTVRAVQLMPGRSGLRVQHWLSQPLPGAADRRAAEDRQEEKPSSVEARPPEWSQAKLTGTDAFAGREVVTALAPPDIDVCSLHVPEKLLEQDRDRLVRAIRSEVARHVSIAVDAAEMDAWRLPPGQPNGPNLMVAAAKRSVIQALLAWLGSQKLTCKRIDVAPLAALRVCSRMVRDPSPDHLWGVLDVGLRASRLYLGKGDTPVYVRSLRASGDLMTRRLVNELGIDIQTADRYKRHFGLSTASGSYRPSLSDTESLEADRMASILQGTLMPIVRGMAQDIEKSFRYAIDLYPGLPVSELLLVGGGSNLRGLGELLSNILGIEVRPASAESLGLANANHPSLQGRVFGEMATCFGMCFGEVRP